MGIFVSHSTLNIPPSEELGKSLEDAWMEEKGKKPLSGFQTVLRNPGGPCTYCKVQPWGTERRAVPRCGGGGGSFL